MESGKRQIMEFSYRELGAALAWNRKKKNLRQSDLENLSGDILKQPAISAAERGENRMAVDTLVTYCNLLGIRPDVLLEPFLNTEAEDDLTGAIVDPYALQMVSLMSDCSIAEKVAILKMAEIIKSISSDREAKTKIDGIEEKKEKPEV